MGQTSKVCGDNICKIEVVDGRLRRFLYFGNATNKILWVNHGSMGKLGQTSNIFAVFVFPYDVVPALT